MAISCTQFTDYLIRKSEHLDDDILVDLRPASTVIGHVETGRFPAEDGVSHTFDRLNMVFPDMSTPWSDVTAGACIGAPCDPSETKIGMGYTRDMYKLQQKSYATDLFCYDLIMSADKAKQSFANTIKVLRRATNLIMSDRLRCEMFRIAGYHWLADLDGLTAFTFNENNTNLINLTVSGIPTSLMVINHLRQRVETQLLQGAAGEGNLVEGAPPEIEVLADYHTIWDMVQGDSDLKDSWRFQNFATGAEEYSKFGWKAKVGNFMLHADLEPLRFQYVNANTISRVFPYYNIPTTSGIKEIVNPQYITAPIEAIFIWHRRAMQSLVRDTTQINPMMPFAARDFAGKWQFCMDNITCGTAVAKNSSGADITIPIPVDNSRRNKGVFKADFSLATKAQYPEFAEVFLCLREPPVVIGKAPCTTTPAYVYQDFTSDNDVCP